MEKAMADAVAAKQREKARNAPNVLKRPAASGSSDTGRVYLKKQKGNAPTSKDSKTKPGIEYYRGGTIYNSDLKSGYRVLLPGEKRVDKLFKLHDYF